MKKTVIFLAIILAVQLSGCGSVTSVIENNLKKQIYEKSEVLTDVNYSKYEEYSEDGKLDEEGYYTESAYEQDKASDEGKTLTGVTHVSFSSNAYLEVEYFADKEKTIPLGDDSCDLSVGGSIYATVVVSKDAASSQYSFAGFEIYQYQDDGRELMTTTEPSTDGLVLTITKDYIGKNISIDPIGKYVTRTISLQDSYLDNDEIKHNLSGKWVVNDREITGEEVDINPVSSYVISYEFDGDQYFYLSSEPECYYSNNDDGIVIFNKREPTDATTDYSVTLHEYVSVSLTSEEDRFVTLNSSRGVIYDGSEQEVKAKTELVIPRLKYGDTVTIVTDKPWDDLERCRELILQSTEKQSNQDDTFYIYKLIVPQKGGEFEFDPVDYKYEHGTLIFKCFGDVVHSTQYLAKGAKITYEEGTVDKGYRLAGNGNNEIIVGNEETTREQLENIRFVPTKKVSVELKQPEYGGIIHYYSEDGNEIYGDTYETESGSIITMKFEPWEGWISEYKNNEKYTVTDDSTQTLSIGKVAVGRVFKEDPNHKPSLEVVLDKSVGKNMDFSFSASGLSKSDYHYKDGWFRNDYMIIDPRKVSIGTEKGIVISMGNRAIRSGTAVKIFVEKEDRDKQKESYYRLVTNLNDLQDPIPIYDDGPDVSNKWYKSIRINISVVDVIEFNKPATPEHGSITVRNTGTSTDLIDGDIIEGSQQVTVTIAPDSGYYVGGKDTVDDIYNKSMSYSKYASNIENIVEKHPIKKYGYVTLQSEDDYGVSTYRFNKKVVSGTVPFKEGQAITVEYKITSPGYIIEGSKGFMGTPLGKNDQTITKKISLSSDMDGKTIGRESFGIKVVERK